MAHRRLFSNTLNTPGAKDFNGLKVEMSNLETSPFALNSPMVSLPPEEDKILPRDPFSDPPINKGVKEMLKSYCGSIMSKLSDPEILILSKPQYDQQLQALTKQHKSTQITLIAKIKDLEDQISAQNTQENPKNPQNTKNHPLNPEQNPKPSQSELKFLLALKEKIKLLATALRKEKEDNNKLKGQLKKAHKEENSDNESTTSFSNNHNPFVLNEERSRGYTMIHRSRGNSMICSKKDELNNSK